MKQNEIETFCQGHGFLFHEHGSGTFRADRYWSYTKVEDNSRIVFLIDYFPVRNLLKIRAGATQYCGTPESLSHMEELLRAMRITL